MMRFDACDSGALILAACKTLASAATCPADAIDALRYKTRTRNYDTHRSKRSTAEPLVAVDEGPVSIELHAASSSCHAFTAAP